ncbi:hypothetical protein GHT06_011092 [Daphnia sinensis]|uniref:Methyltransferase domain-containing protein n=1 Tax=Daphnia sinensis TaxID=1820382 RepID=A0AAD5LTC1_9CRUS|nr:hypothetical protein GHT06_011092 [Daphnia sinensis]
MLAQLTHSYRESRSFCSTNISIVFSKQMFRIQHSAKIIVRFLLCLAVLSLFLTLYELAYFSHEDNRLVNTEASTTSDEMDSWSVSQMMAFLDSGRMTNRSSCNVFYEFGGVVINDTYRYKDGQKSVCLDDGLKPAVNDCLVYSFGIDNEWSFDDDMAKLGCDVYSFDPSMEENDHNRSPQIHFFQIGIWNRDGHIFLDKKRPDVAWKVLTLSSIYERLKLFHGQRIIDYVKIDIEGDEWTILPEIIQSGILNRIKQFAMEIHFDGDDSVDDIRQRIKLLLSLEREHGMIPFDYKNNLNSRGFVPAAPNNYACAEIVYFNSKFKNVKFN